MSDVHALPARDAHAAHRLAEAVARRLDVLPLGDVSIYAAAADVHGLRRRVLPKRLTRLAKPWRPYRSVAVWYLYEHLDASRAGA